MICLKSVNASEFTFLIFFDNYFPYVDFKFIFLVVSFVILYIYLSVSLIYGDFKLSLIYYLLLIYFKCFISNI